MIPIPVGGIWLDLACGANKQPGAVGMDIRALPGVDIVQDLYELPWPLPDDCCARVLMSHIVEHLQPWRVWDIFNEVWRVMQPRGQLFIATPYAGSPRFWQDPTHTHGWMEATPQYLDPAYPLYGIYRPQPWHIDLLEWHSVGDLSVILSKLPEPEPAYGTHENPSA